ncbi:hypothetical protein ACFL5F_06725 [Planctomycetota bacterium]
MKTANQILCAVLLVVVFSPCVFAHDITIDASGVDTNIKLLGLEGTDFIPSGEEATYSLSEGTYALESSQGGTFAAFRVGGDGVVQYDPEYIGVISGNGTSTVKPIGHPVTIDATDVCQDIGFGDWNSSDSFLGWTATGTTRTYRLVANTQWDYALYVRLGFIFAFFSVNPDGTVHYNVAYEGVISVDGTSTVKPIGHPVTIDATDVCQDIGFGDWNSSDSFLGWTATGTTRTYRLVANTQWDYALYVRLGFIFAFFSVNPDGTIHYNVAYEGVISGNGTSTVKPVGHPVTIDATEVVDDGQSHSEDIAFGSWYVPESFLGWIESGEAKVYNLVANTLYPYGLYSPHTYPTPMQFNVYADGSCSPVEITFLAYGTIKLYPATSLDSDGDGLTDDEEVALGTDPLDDDTDDDGLLDGTEVEIAEGSGCPDPLNPDSDGDTLADGAEVDMGTSPCNVDTDGDTIPDNIDPYPTDPEGTEGYIEAETRDLADFIRGLDLNLFTGPNSNANKGRRTALANRADAAANNIADEDFLGAIGVLLSLTDRVDDVSVPKDWMVDSTEKTCVLNTATTLMGLLDYLI